MRSSDRLIGAALLGASLFVLGWNLGGEGPDRRGEWVARDIARTMRETGDWITPRLLGEPYFKKPPLHYWCVAASAAFGGVSIEAARRPVVLFSLAGLLLASVWAKEIGGARAGVLAAAVALGNTLYFLSARTAMMDAPLAVLVAASTRWLGRGALLRGWAAAGLGFLAKGPLGVLLPVGAVGLERLLTRRGRELGRLFAPSGILAFLLVAAPWPIAMTARHGTAFVRTFFVEEGLLAFATDEGHRSTSPWPYLPILLSSFTVFAPALFGAARAAWRSPSSNLR
ncbi:MAG TPA: glycosyltransferase family 39 protein, partial [Planctomycetota bacterium]|nr:glycosyltransferase family 39 protein [Planctomycetota bacterium]